MIRLSGIDHVHLHVGDVDRSLRFYTSAFGAEEAFRVGERLVFVRLPGTSAIIAIDGRADGERNPEHVGLSLATGDDLADAVEEVLRAGGSVLEQGEHAPDVPYAYVGDPDGNVLELS